MAPATTITRLRRAVRWPARLLLALLVAVAGIVLGLRLAGPMERDTALGRVSLRIAPSVHGAVDAFIPLADWGVRARAFSAPLVIHLEPRTIDRQAVIRASAGERRVLAAAQADGRRAAREALLRALAWAVGGAAALALLAAGAVRWGARRSRRAAAAAGGAILAAAAAIAGGSVVRVDRTFAPEAFAAPSFYARGAELGQLLKVADRAPSRTRAYRTQVDRTLSSYATLLRAGGRPGLEPPGQRAVLVSDLHANTLVLPTLGRLATGSPVFFAGDFAQSGTAAEARLLVRRITRLGRVVAVSGNHDSRLFMRRLAGAGATVLTRTGRLGRDGKTDGRPVVRIDGLLVAGYDDPLESRTGNPNDSDRIFSFSERPDGDREFAQAKRDIVAWFRGLDPRPDVVLVHQNGLAQALARALRAERGQRLLVLTGHDHLQHVDLHGQTIVVDAGTVGAGGLLGAGKDPIGVAQLELSPGSAWPGVIDLVQVEPLSGAAQADRVLPTALGVCETGRVVCHEGDEPPAGPGDPPEPAGRR